MTAQDPERIILDGRPRALYTDPLYRLRKRCRLDLSNPNYRSTSNYRGYIGTWAIRDRRLHLTQLSWDGQDEIPVSDELGTQLFRAAGGDGFPIFANWFNGRIKIPTGRRLIYSHHGWSHWFERERVIQLRAGEIVRDREVDTRAILERWLRQYPEASYVLSSSNPLAPLIWFEDEPEDWTIDWWPPDHVRPPTCPPN
jgi:hypothetical protein